MALLNILSEPDPRLRQVSKLVDKVDEDIRQLIDSMFDTMYANQGIGLAAPQVGILRRLLVVDIPSNETRGIQERNDSASFLSFAKLALINPEITWKSELRSTFQEGCLSVPEYRADIIRPEAIRITYLDLDNQKQEIAATGLLATCIQHEIDHLNGVLFIDYLSKMKRRFVLKKLLKIKRRIQIES